MGEDILHSLDRCHDALHTQMNVLEASSERRSKLVQDGVSQLQSNLQEQTDQLHGHFIGQNKESRSCRLDGAIVLLIELWQINIYRIISQFPDELH